jgi:hypothetical protein
MAQLSGTWTLKVVAHKLKLLRVVITGSDNADGVYFIMEGPLPKTVQGVNFEVKSQFHLLAPGEWKDTSEKDVMSWDPVKGVILTILADRSAFNPKFDDLIIECTSSDSELIAPPLNNPPMVLTIPEKYVRNRKNDDHSRR